MLATVSEQGQDWPTDKDINPEYSRVKLPPTNVNCPGLGISPPKSNPDTL